MSKAIRLRRTKVEKSNFLYNQGIQLQGKKGMASVLWAHHNIFVMPDPGPGLILRLPLNLI